MQIGWLTKLIVPPLLPSPQQTCEETESEWLIHCQEVSWPRKDICNILKQSFPKLWIATHYWEPNLGYSPIRGVALEWVLSSSHSDFGVAETQKHLPHTWEHPIESCRTPRNMEISQGPCSAMSLQHWRGNHCLELSYPNVQVGLEDLLF